MAVLSYFDSSGDPGTESETYLTLGSYSGPEKVWNVINPAWQEVLRKHNAPYLHMAEAMSLSGAFKVDKGWDSERVSKLVIDLAEIVNCYSERTLLSIVFSIQMDGYRRAAAETKNQVILRPATICAVESLQRILPSLTPHCGDANSTINIYRDDREPYLGELVQDWKSKKMRFKQPILSRINNISAVGMKVAPGIQMADMIAWTAHRCLTSPPSDMAHSLWPILRVQVNRLFGEMQNWETSANPITGI